MCRHAYPEWAAPRTPRIEDLVAAGLHLVGLLLATMVGAKKMYLAVSTEANAAQRQVVKAFVVAWLLMYVALVAYQLAPQGWWRLLRADFDKGAIVVVIAADREIAQLPLYTVWVEGSLSDRIYSVLHFSVGDVMIALSSLGAAIMVLGAWHRPSARFVPVVWALTLIGIAYALFSEWLIVEWRCSWAYVAAMPCMPWLGTRVTPLLQWLLLPPLCLLVARRLVGRTPNFGAVS